MPNYQDVPNILPAVVKKANFDLYEITLKTGYLDIKNIIAIFDAQAKVELQILVNQNPEQNWHWPRNNPIIGYVK